MATKQFTRKRRSSHLDSVRRRARSTPQRCRPVVELKECAPKNRDDLLGMLSDSLASIETASMALRAYEEQPGLGSISLALETAVRSVERAHQAVGLFVYPRR
jgi:hypothetical protein